MPSRATFSQQFTNRLIETIKTGTAPWQRRWNPGEMPHPVNGITGHLYTGGNLVMLLATGRLDPRWAGFGQIKKAKGMVRRGEEGTPILIAKTVRSRKQDEESKDEELRTFFSGAWIFNFEQTDRLPSEPPISVPITENEAGHRLKTIINRANVTIRHADHGQPCYDPELDQVIMPSPDRFCDLNEYRQALLHEISHATGHPSRMNRWATQTPSTERRTPEYATEELRAEVSAMLLGQKLGVGHNPDIKNSEAYMTGWLKGLANEPDKIHRAITEAQAISDWLLNTQDQAQLTQAA